MPKVLPPKEPTSASYSVKTSWNYEELRATKEKYYWKGFFRGYSLAVALGFVALLIIKVAQ